MSSVVFYCACGQSSLIDIPCPVCHAKMDMDYDESKFGNGDGVKYDKEDREPVSGDGAFGQGFWEV